MDAPLYALESEEPPKARSMQRMGMRSADKSGASPRKELGLVGVGGVPAYYSEGGIQIFHGDCREIIPLLGDVDAVLTDPPYGIGHKSSFDATWSGKEIAGDQNADVRDWVWGHYAGKPRAMFGISWRVRPPEGVRMTLVWDKGPAFGAGDLRLPWKPSWEEIYIAGDGWEGRRDEGVLRGPCVVSWESQGRMHPHQKPVWLMCRLMEKLPLATVFLDPFMGSGTTLEAAKLLGRQCIGIDVDEGHCANAVKRLKQECLSLGGGGAELVGAGNAETRSRAASHTVLLTDCGHPEASK